MTDLERFAAICAQSWTDADLKRLDAQAAQAERSTDFERFAATLTAWEEK